MKNILKTAILFLQMFVTETQTYGDVGQNQISAENAEFYQKVMLERYLENIEYSKWGKTKNIPKNSGATTSFRRLELPTTLPSTYSITEGTTPDGINLTVNKVSATVAQHGAWTKITDYLDMTGLDPLITETAEMFGEHAARVNDNVVKEVLEAGTNVVYANGKVSRVTVAAGDNISYADILKIYETLRTNRAPKIKLPNGMMGYVILMHPAVMTFVKQLNEWIEANKFQTPENIKAGIVGELGGLHFIETSEATIAAGAGAAGIDVYLSVAIGNEAYGMPDIGGSMKPDIIVKSPEGNNSDTSNPLNLYGTVAWKSLFTALRLNEAGIVRYESAVV